MCPSATPRPLDGARCKARRDWVEGEIANGGDELLVARDLVRCEVRAEQVGASLVRLIVSARITRVQLLHRARDARVRGVEDHVVVVAHERVGNGRQSVTAECGRKENEEALAVGVGDVEKSSVASVRCEVEEAVEEGTPRTRHAPTVRRPRPAVACVDDLTHIRYTQQLTKPGVGHRDLPPGDVS